MTQPARPSWRVYDASFIGDVADPDRSTAPWSGHRWFGYDLVRWQRPARFVELGTHWGCSFLALAQAVMDGVLDTECHAIDTWKGDHDAGFYGPEVHETFVGIADEWLSPVDVQVHRSSFDEALGLFADETIDLLHIDGYHSYEAVSHDFDTWLPKVAPNGIVLLHDVSPMSGYGSATFWQEIREVYPGFDFPHNFGLGVVLPKGVAGRDYLFSDEFAMWRSYYTEKAGNDLGSKQNQNHIRMIEERDEVIARQTRMIEDRDQAITNQGRMIEDRDQSITAQARMIEDRDQVITNQDRMIEDRDQAITAQAQMIEDYMSQLEKATHSGLKEGIRRLAKAMPEPVPTWLLRARRRWWQIRSPAVDTQIVAFQGRPEGNAQTASDGAPQNQEPMASPGFDSQFYMNFSEGLDFSTMAPFDHYLGHGIREGIPPTRTALCKAALHLMPAQHEVVENRPLEYRLPRAAGQIIRRYTQLPHQVYDLVTIDFWQTLVLRNRPAESVKLDTARFLAQQVLGPHRRQGREHYAARLRAEERLATERRTDSGWGEYHAREALALGLELLLPNLPLTALDDAVEAALAHEIEAEVLHATLNQELSAWIKQVADDGLKVAIISDFYLDGSILKRILESIGFETPPPILVSCEVGSSKAAEGELFVAVRKQFGVEPSRHLHIGDNEYSDVDMQLSTGGAAVLVPQPIGVANRPSGPLEEQDLSGLFTALTDHSPTPAPRRKVEDIHHRRELHTHLMDRCAIAGWRLTSLPTLLTIAGMEMAKKAGLDRVNYVSREGALLARVHEAISDTVGMSDIRAVHIPTSRQATFAPSLDGLTDDLHRLWSFYQHQSPNEFLSALGLPPARFRTRLLAHGLEPDARIWSMWDEPAFGAFLRQRSVNKEILGALGRQQEQAARFLTTALGEDDVSVIVDTGWRGTIQDNVASIFPTRRFEGVYLGLLNFLNEQPENATKVAIGPDTNLGDDTKWLEPHVGVIERLLSPPISSTLSYSGRKGIVLSDITSQSTLLDTFQDGVVAGSTAIAEAYVHLGGEVTDLKPTVIETMRSLLLQPDPGASDAFFSVRHSDDFGTAGPETSAEMLIAAERLALRIGRGLPPPDFGDLFWSAGLRRCFPIEAALTGWW